MFGASYSRTTFWIVSLIAFFVGGFLLFVIQTMAKASGNDSLEPIFTLILAIVLINTLANRIRDYGSNPWLALWSLLPLVGLLQALYFGFLHKKSVSSSQNTSFGAQGSQQQESPEIKDFHHSPSSASGTQSTSNSNTAPQYRLPIKDFN